MEEFVVYILYSEKYNAIYIGYTSSIIQRFYSHNQLVKKGYTLRYRPWKVLEIEFYKNKSKAIRREKALKSGQGRKYIRTVVVPKYIEIGFISA